MRRQFTEDEVGLALQACSDWGRLGAALFCAPAGSEGRLARRVMDVVDALAGKGVGAHEVPSVLSAALWCDRHGARLSGVTEVSRLADSVWDMFPKAPAAEQPVLLGLGLALEAMVVGRRAALTSAIRHAADGAVADPFEVGRMLNGLGWFEDLDVVAVQEIGDGLGLWAHPEARLRRLVWFGLGLLDFTVEAPDAWAEAVYEGFVLPVVLGALEARLVDLALDLESFLYGAWLKRKEAEEHYDRSFAAWVPAMREAGLRAAAALPALQWPAATSDPPVVGIFLHSASMLAHIELIIELLTEAQRQSPRPFVPRIYTLSGNSPQMNEAFRAIGVAVVPIMDGAPASFTQRFLWLRQRLQQDGVTALVWGCLPTAMAYAFSLRLAPVQIWLSMKMHPRSFDFIDGYVGVLGWLTDRLQLMGREWRVIPACTSRLFDGSLAAKARAIRAEVSPGGGVILGTMTREEMMATPEFLDTLTSILRRHPGAVWLYTGRTNHPAIVTALREAGVLHQARFIGWVDTKLYAQVLDIFVDTWPLGGGLTMMQSMAAGVPLVFRDRPADAVGQWNQMDEMVVRPLRSNTGFPDKLARMRALFSGERDLEFLLCAADKDTYCAFVDRLIADVPFRRACGEAHRRFAAEFWANTAWAGHQFSRHVTDIIKEKADAQIH